MMRKLSLALVLLAATADAASLRGADTNNGT